MTVYGLTTSDNPHDQFEDFYSWYQFNTEHGYDPSSLLASVVEASTILSDTLTEYEENKAVEEAIDFIVGSKLLNPIGFYEKNGET